MATNTSAYSITPSSFTFTSTIAPPVDSMSTSTPTQGSGSADVSSGSATDPGVSQTPMSSSTFVSSSITVPSSTSSTTSSTTSSITSMTSTSSISTTSSSSLSSSTTTTTASPTSFSPTSTFTSIQVVTPTASNQSTSTIYHTVTEAPSSTSPSSTQPSSSSASSTSTDPAGLQAGSTGNSGGGGLSASGTTAVAVVVPIVVVAVLVLLGIFFWRRRKQTKKAQEERRKEVEEYGYNPNDDPTLPAVAGFAGSDSPEMTEESGYRGWGNNTNGTMSARKPSTNLSSGIGMAVSDGENGGTRSPGSPGTHPSEGGRSGDALVDGAAVAGGVGATGAGAYMAKRAVNGNGVHRGPSNASSTYSAANRTDDSGDIIGGAQDLTFDSSYSQYTPYQAGNTGYAAENAQPIIRDVSARRNTKVENAVYPQAGNSGIAQNF